MHIVGANAEYPFAAQASYRTQCATVSDYRTVMQGLGIERVVVVQPSFYGTDNRCAIDAIKELDQARLIAVIDPDSTTGVQLEQLEAAKCCGVRINHVSLAPQRPLAELVLALDRLISPLGWHIQCFIGSQHLVELLSLQPSLKAPLVIDHLALLRPELLAFEPLKTRFSALCSLLQDGAWAKLSGFYRFCDDPASPALGEMIQRLVEIAPQRLLWGSDWPHTLDDPQIERTTLLNFRDIDTADYFSPIPTVLSDSVLQQSILVDNPARCYRFANE